MTINITCIYMLYFIHSFGLIPGSYFQGLGQIPENFTDLANSLIETGIWQIPWILRDLAKSLVWHIHCNIHTTKGIFHLSDMDVIFIDRTHRTSDLLDSVFGHHSIHYTKTVKYAGICFWFMEFSWLASLSYFDQLVASLD